MTEEKNWGGTNCISHAGLRIVHHESQPVFLDGRVVGGSDVNIVSSILCLLSLSLTFVLFELDLRR